MGIGAARLQFRNLRRQLGYGPGVGLSVNLQVALAFVEIGYLLDQHSVVRGECLRVQPNSIAVQATQSNKYRVRGGCTPSQKQRSGPAERFRQRGADDA